MNITCKTETIYYQEQTSAGLVHVPDTWHKQYDWHLQLCHPKSYGPLKAEMYFVQINIKKFVFLYNDSIIVAARASVW
mgnify:CR=1 FL=1